MFANQRLNIIRQTLLKERQVDISTLASLLNVSDVTVRKDLTVLEKENFLRKVHGGAVLVDPEELLSPVPEDQQSNLEQIAELALSLIDDFDNLFLGSEPACLFLAKKLNSRKSLTVLTNNVLALPHIDTSLHNVVFIGGTVAQYANQIFTYGKKALDFLDNMYVDKAFLGADCIDTKIGVTINQVLYYEIYDRILHVSRNATLLACCDQFNRTAMQRLCPLNQFQTVVTDGLVPDNIKDYCFAQDIKLLTSFDIPQ